MQSKKWMDYVPVYARLMEKIVKALEKASD